MIPDERRHQILELLNQNHYMSVEDLAAALYVSLPTIRRDLTSLEKEGSIKRMHGGASFNSPKTYPSPYVLRKKTNQAEKDKIGRIAAALVQNNDTLFITASSTCLSFVKHLNMDNHLQVITNGIPLAHILSEHSNITVECPPGVYYYAHESIFGKDVADYISKRHVKYCFMSCNGVDLDFGISYFVDLDVPIVQTCRKNCDQLIVLVDHTKLDQKYYYQALDFKDIDGIITDRPLNERWLKACKENHITVYTDQ